MKIYYFHKPIKPVKNYENEINKKKSTLFEFEKLTRSISITKL